MSWFLQIRELFLQYLLPHPLTFLLNPISKEKFKHLVKMKVRDFWQHKLRKETVQLKSLAFFKPHFMSLSQPYPIWTTSKLNPYETSKAIVQAKMLSGRYRTESLCRFWSSNSAGVCLLPACSTSNVPEDISHILLHCSSLAQTRSKLITFFFNSCSKYPLLSDIITNFILSTDNHFKTQFLLDCSTLPDVIRQRQLFGFPVLQQLFSLTRTWCFSLHRDRLRMLGRWRY